MWRFSAYFVVFVLLPAMYYAADPINVTSLELQDQLNSCEKKFQEMERSMLRMEGIVSRNTLAMETFAEVSGKRNAELSRIELYVSQQQEILSKLPILQDNMEKLFDNIQAQINTQTSQNKSINNIAEDIATKLSDVINTTKGRVQHHENEFEVARARMDGIETLLENMQTKVDSQTGTLEKITELLTTKTDQPSHLLQIRNNQLTLKMELQNNFTTIKSELHSLKSSVGSIDSKATVIKNGVEATKLNVQELVVESFRNKNNLGTDRTSIMSSACSYGDAIVVTALLDLGMHVDTRVDSESNTCLHRAAENNRVNVANVLLDRGADTELTDTTSWGETPLLEAAYEGKVEVARVLVERGASLSARDKKDNMTPLGYAKKKNRQEMINYLRSVNATE